MTHPLIYTRCPDDFVDLMGDRQAHFANRAPLAAERRSACVKLDDMGRIVCRVFNGIEDNLVTLRETPAEIQPLFRLAHDGDAAAIERLHRIATECVEDVDACPTKNIIRWVRQDLRALVGELQQSQRDPGARCPGLV